VAAPAARAGLAGGGRVVLDADEIGRTIARRPTLFPTGSCRTGTRQHDQQRDTVLRRTSEDEVRYHLAKRRTVHLTPEPRSLTLWLLALVLPALAGCGTLPRTALPVELVDQATLPDMPTVRAPGGRIHPTMAEDLAKSFAQESVADFPYESDGRIHYAHLILSGGGPNGAFGAGILNGWTKAGNRPVFKIVTGVSTGALMAPFAFLGSEYDDELREFYTTTTSSNVFRRLSLLPQLFRGESLADSTPLRSMLAKAIDAELLKEVARAHQSGRRLYVGTADLDSQRFIVWNMGLIAASGRPGALDLFRQVMLASASVPVAFPPVLFEVEANGARYDELHVDGAVGASLFYSGGVFDFRAARKSSGRSPAMQEIYVIHNGQLAPVHSVTSRTLSGIALRTLEAAGKAGVLGDLFRIHAVTARSEANFRWVTMPGDVSLVGETVFDPVVMGRLYELGYSQGITGDFWNAALPGLEP
jgi:hypothetical protein